MSKGSARRPGDQKRYSENWDRIFAVGHYASHPNTGASLIDARPSPCGECERLKTELGDRVAYCEMVVLERDDLRAEIERLRGALSRASLECNNLSHRKGEYHLFNEPCPVEAMVKAALAAGRGNVDPA